MSEWKEYKLGEVISFGNGKERPKEKGSIPVYGGNGILDYTNTHNYEGETIILGRVGAYCGSVYYSNTPIWVSDNALVAKPKEGHNTKFFYYYLTHIKLNDYAEGSSHPLITQRLLNSIDIRIPTNELEQRSISSILTSLDDKIDLLRRENATLEAMAETLFRQWFVVEAKEEWEEGKLGDICDYVTDKIDVTNINQDTYVSTENMCSNKQGIVMSSSKPQNIKVTKYLVNDVLLSNIRPYFKKIWLSDMNGGCSNDVLCIRSKKDEFKYFTYYNIRQDEFFDYVMLGSKGCKMPRGDKSHIMNWPIWIPSNKVLNNFNNIVTGGIKKIKNNNTQIQTLTQTRDGLLPKLMSNEVKITI